MKEEDYHDDVDEKPPEIQKKKEKKKHFHNRRLNKKEKNEVKNTKNASSSRPSTSIMKKDSKSPNGTPIEVLEEKKNDGRKLLDACSSVGVLRVMEEFFVEIYNPQRCKPKTSYSEKSWLMMI